MANHPLSSYRKKSYCAKRVIFWVDEILKSPDIKLIENIKGVDLIEVNFSMVSPRVDSYGKK
jgi:hypothetical protein